MHTLRTNWKFVFFAIELLFVLSLNIWKRSPFIHDIRHPIPSLWTYTIFRRFVRDFDYNQLRISLPGPRLSRIFLRLSLFVILLSTLDVLYIWKFYHSQLCFDNLEIKFFVHYLVYLEIFWVWFWMLQTSTCIPLILLLTIIRI